MHLCPRRWVRPLQLLNRPQYPPPHRAAVQIPLLKHGIRPHGGVDRRVLAVLLHEHMGRAVDVEFGVIARDYSRAGADFCRAMSV